VRSFRDLALPVVGTWNIRSASPVESIRYQPPVAPKTTSEQRGEIAV
jgi:hypothetical protein